LTDVRDRLLILLVQAQPNQYAPAPNPSTEPLRITALDMGTLLPAWTYTVPYKPASVQLDEAGGRLLVVAPGGRVTVMGLARGHVAGVARMRAPATVQNQGAVQVDWVHHRAFVFSYTATGPAIDVVDWVAGIRRHLIVFPPFQNPGALGGALPGHQAETNWKLIGIDEPSGTPILSSVLWKTGGAQVQLIESLDPVRGRIYDRSLIQGALAAMLAAPPGAIDAPPVLVCDHSLYGSAQVTQSNDVTGPQKVMALIVAGL
jgi:hypothetical protein